MEKYQTIVWWKSHQLSVTKNLKDNSLTSRSKSNTSSSDSDERPLIPAKRSKPGTTKVTNRPRFNPRSTATESVVTGGGDAPNPTIDANGWTRAAGGSTFQNFSLFLLLRWL